MSASWGATALLCLLLSSLTGCFGAPPFTRAPLPALTNADPAAVRTAFAKRLPDRFTSEDSVTVQVPFRDDMAFLGIVQVDRPAQTFEFVALSPLGVTLFKLGGDRSDASVRYAAPPLQQYQTYLAAMALDLREVFLDLAPGADATADVGRTSIQYTRKTPAGTFVYALGGDPPALLEKRRRGWFGGLFDGLFGASWRARYYGAGASPSGFDPDGIVVDSGRVFHYRIILRRRSASAP